MRRPSSSIIRILKRSGYSDRFARMWVAVAKHESANFTSRLFRSVNNPFGMQHPRVRKTTSIGPFDLGREGKMASYKSVADAARDLVFYLEAFKYPKDFETVDQLVAFMKSKGYFTDSVSNYLNGVKKWYSTM